MYCKTKVWEIQFQQIYEDVLQRHQKLFRVVLLVGLRAPKLSV